MSIYFVTGNQGKLREARLVIPELEHVEIDLPEIQSLDVEAILETKLAAAVVQHSGKLVVEDTSLHLDAINGFPGPLIKWLLQSVGTQGIYDICQAAGKMTATARVTVGFHASDGNTHFFTGELAGTIVPPKGIEGFGWDAIFVPKGSAATFAQMGSEQKAAISHRTKAFQALRDYLETASSSF